MARAGQRPDVVMLEGYLDHDDKNALVAACDSYVSLHRSEGFGFTVAEAMALGRPVIATGYSGVMGFLNDANGFLVGYRPASVPSGTPHYPEGAGWAEPDLDDAARLMRQVAGDPNAARKTGEQAAADIARLHSPFARAGLIRERLADIESRRSKAGGRLSRARRLLRRSRRGRSGG